MKRATILFLTFITFIAGSTQAQVLSGASFLRALPGARTHAMSGSAAAGLDGAHSIYANPGLAGFAREGLWSASFTSWIADVYNASFIYGRRIRTPLSRWSRLSLGLFYQGMKEFDSTDGAAPLASASDLVLSGTFGLPLTAINHGLSAGLSAKYFHSNLDYFSANAVMLDAGLFYRTPRFDMPLAGLGLFPDGILSGGLSMSNIGGDIKYIAVGTPLPRALRAGVALNAGSHHGLQTQLSLDWVKFRDEEAGLHFGVELSWSRLFAINGGYQKSDGLLDQATFGLSVNLDNFLLPVGGLMPESATALRLDVATQDEKEFFSRTFRGSVTSYTIGPEAFRQIWPEANAFYEHDSLVFEWEPSREADLYDDVSYHLIAGRDSTELADLLLDMQQGVVSPSSIDLPQNLLVNELMDSTRFELHNFARGGYFWSVVAYDSDQHLRLAKRNGQEINYFYIPRPDLIVEKMEHVYYDLIDSTESHGTIYFTIKNQGEMAAIDVPVALIDSVLTPIANLGNQIVLRQTEDFTIDELQPGASKTLAYEWNRATLGPCKIIVIPDATLRISELDEANNRGERIFYTVPKGVFTTAADTSLALLTSRVVVELPYINQVSFAPNSTEIEGYYLRSGIKDFDPTLNILGERMRTHDQTKVTLVGYADPNTDDPQLIDLPENAPMFSGQVIQQDGARAIAITPTLRRRLEQGAVNLPDPLFHLAFQRAKAVQDSLLGLNVAEEQTLIDSIKVYEIKRFSARATQQDKEMLLHERRQVEIHASPQDEEILFEPVKKIDDEPVRDPIQFTSNIAYAALLKDARVDYSTDLNGDPWHDALYPSPDSLQGMVNWPIDTIDLDTLNQLMGKNIVYAITLTDTLDRVFHNLQDTLVFSNDFQLRQHRISFPLKFGQAKLLYGNYWNRIYSLGDSLFHEADPIRLTFEGHSCVIGDSTYNRKLSQKRANDLKAAYFDWVKQNHPDKLPEILSHVDKTALGRGESTPLTIIRLRTAPILIGDNQLPIGRKFNRRIEIIYYSPLAR